MSAREAEFGARFARMVTDFQNLMSEAIQLGKDMESQRRDLEASVQADMAGLDAGLKSLLGGDLS